MSASAKEPNDSPASGDTTTGGEGTEAYRILIVEDDRSQALFAETVLHGAGMRTHWVANAGDVLPALADFAPDLVLMDLHLPDMSGAELTATLREDPAHANIPIVFLTGDPDPDRQYEVLDSGADDFLSKPVRPRHLISAVQNRVKRARAQRSIANAYDPDDIGLMRRAPVLERLSQAPGALLIEVQNVGVLQERYGYTGLDGLLRGAVQRLAAALKPGETAARLNDNTFLVLAPTPDARELETLARRLRDALGQPHELSGIPMRLRTAVGHAGFAPQQVANPLEALEQALRSARGAPTGLAGYTQPVLPRHDDSRTAELRAALTADGGLEFAFQPIVSVAGGDEAQYQLLLRLRGSDGRLRSAGELIASAETSGLLAELDLWALERALDLLAQRKAAGKPARFFVSQSIPAIAADPHGEWLSAQLVERSLEPGALVIDVPLEDALVHALTLREFCDRLAPIGVGFCLGRYQHGADAAALLQQLPLTHVRLSRHYSDASANTEVRDELRSAISAAHASGLRVIGAQVENPSAAAALWMSGIDYIQGNLVQGAGDSLDFDFHHSVL